MNIQQYYERSAGASLNAGLAAFIPSILLVIYAVVISHYYQLILLVAPFLIYSFFCYQKFLLNQKRAKAAELPFSEAPLSPKKLLEEAELLITFLPAPTLRLLLFTADGMKAGEIRDQSFSAVRWFLPYIIDRFFVKKYGLYNHNDEPIVIFHQFRNRIEILSPAGEKLAVLDKLRHEKKQGVIIGNREMTIEAKGGQDYDFLFSDGKKAAHIQTGWMPLEWGKRFVNANTPILYLNEQCTKDERLQLFSLLASHYAYYNH